MSSVQNTTMALSIFLICVLGKFVIAEEVISPCPNVLEYDENPRTADQYYATATLTSEFELSGIWFRIKLDGASLNLGTGFGKVAFRDNNTSYVYVIKNPRYKLKPNSPLQIRFGVQYNPNGPIPRIASLRLNGRQICPIGQDVTEAQETGQLFTDKQDPVAFPPPYEGGLNIENTSGDEGDHFKLRKTRESEPYIVNEAICGTVVNVPQPPIINGEATQEGQFPWHAALYHSQLTALKYMCGASLISMKHLIIVAHCVTERKSTSLINPNNLVVYFGKFYQQEWYNPGIQIRLVDTILVHPEYDPRTFRHNIAVLKLSESVKLTDYVRPICLWEGPTQLDYVVGAVGTVAGWGLNETDKVTEHLAKTSMQIVSQETCVYSFPEYYSRLISKVTFCASLKSGTPVCIGYAGSGLTLPKSNSDPNNPVWQIRGLVSIGAPLRNGMCDSSRYVVFTDIAQYFDFINKALSRSKGDDQFFNREFYVASIEKPTSRPVTAIPQPVKCGTVAPRASPLISHGQSTTPGQWPWHAALYTLKGSELSYMCGGTLISDQFIVTAAHCVTKPRTNSLVDKQFLVIYLGKHSFISFGSTVQDREIERIIVHPEYNYTLYYNDIAVLKLNSPVELNNFVRPCCLWEDGSNNVDNLVGRQGTVVGWGRDENKQFSRNLMQAKMPIVSTRTCLLSNRDFFSQFIYDTNFCAGFKNGTSVCNGDSGGGMVFPKMSTSDQSPIWQLRGIVSIGVARQGEEVCDRNQYTIFTDAGKFVHWIKQTLQQ